MAEVDLGLVLNILHQMQAEIREIRIELRAMDKRFNAFETDVYRQFAQLQLHVTSLETRMEAGFASLNARVDNVEGRLDKRLDGVDKRLDDVDGHLAHMDHRFDMIDHQLSELWDHCSNNGPSAASVKEP